MTFSIDVSSAPPVGATDLPAPLPAIPETVDLLRQILEVQRELLVQQRNAAAAHDMTARWRSFLSRWNDEFPGLSDNCRKALPSLERTYGRLIAEMAERVNEEDDNLDNDFSLQEFLDRNGMRLAQLGTILNLVAPLAEAGPSSGETA
jgi:hypothetical protein